MFPIESSIKKYEKEYDFYQQLAVSVKDLLETEIYNRGIKAIVTHRTKKVDSLREKLNRRNDKKKYLSEEDSKRTLLILREYGSLYISPPTGRWSTRQ